MHPRKDHQARKAADSRHLFSLPIFSIPGNVRLFVVAFSENIKFICQKMKQKEIKNSLLVYSCCPNSSICTNKVLLQSGEIYLPSHKHIKLQK